MRNLCSYWDWNYMPKGLAMLNSLIRWEDAHVFVLAMDKRTQEWLLSHPAKQITIIGLDEFEDEELRATRPTRSWVEYIWTMTSCITLYILQHWAIPNIAYFDADHYVYAPLTALYEEVSNADIGIVPHRFQPDDEERLQSSGKYNVGWVYFKNSQQGLACLKRWREQCIEWCYKRQEDGKFGDQGYLNDWPEVFSGTHVVEHLGAELAPWNQRQYNYSLHDGKIFVENAPLLYYHFHEFAHDVQGQMTQRTGYPLHPFVAENVYPPYEHEIAEICEELNAP